MSFYLGRVALQEDAVAFYFSVVVIPVHVHSCSDMDWSESCCIVIMCIKIMHLMIIKCIIFHLEDNHMSSSHTGSVLCVRLITMQHHLILILS